MSGNRLALTLFTNCVVVVAASVQQPYVVVAAKAMP
jgi:hypothetical protein